MRNIKLKIDMENYLLQHRIVALKIGPENTDPTKNGKKNTWELHVYILPLVGEREREKRLAIDI